MVLAYILLFSENTNLLARDNCAAKVMIKNYKCQLFLIKNFMFYNILSKKYYYIHILSVDIKMSRELLSDLKSVSISC